MPNLKKIVKSSLAYIHKTRKRTKLAFLFVFFFSVLGTVTVFKTRSIPQPRTLEEPEAELTQEVLSTEFSMGEVAKESTESASVNNEDSATPEKLGKVKKFLYSTDQEYALLLTDDTQTSETTSLLEHIVPKVSADETRGLTLRVMGKNGSTQIIEKDTVLDAEFGGNEYVYYQTLGTSAGIYTYNLSKSKKDTVIQTYDHASFANMTMINDSQYFFIQPTTGKMGFGKLGSNDEVILDTKTLNLQTNYVKASAYTLAGISPDKKYIAVYDKSVEYPAGSSIKVRLQIFPTTAKTLSDMYFSTDIVIAPRNLAEGDSLVRWSSDNALLLAGNNSTIIDIPNKKVLFSTGDSTSITRISPDKKSLFVCIEFPSECYVTDFSQSKKTPVTKVVTQAEWLSKDTVLMVIGQKLYVFSTKSNKLELVKSERNEYAIHDVTANNGKAVVRQGTQLIEVTQK